MNILFLSDNFPPETNAPASRLHEHARYWVGAGHHVTVITGAPNFPEGKLHPGYDNGWYRQDSLDGIRVVRVKTFIAPNEGFFARTLDYLSFMCSGTLAGLLERRPDVIVASSPQFFAALGGWQLARLRRVPFVFEVRDLWPASIVAVGAMREGRLIRELERLELFLYRQARAVIVVTEAFRQDITRRGIHADKVHVVPNGADLAWCSPQPRDEALRARHGIQAELVVGYIGTHGMAHALERVLDAAELLRDVPQIRFFFAGGGAERASLERSVARRGLSNVRLIPRQPKSAMPGLWSACDVALIPLRDEPVFGTVIPSKLFEAMAHGVPVLLSVPAGEATAIVERTGAGRVVPPEDPAALAQALRELWSARHALGVMRARALAAAPQFSRERQARRMIEVLARVAAA